MPPQRQTPDRRLPRFNHVPWCTPSRTSVLRGRWGRRPAPGRL